MSARARNIFVLALALGFTAAAATAADDNKVIFPGGTGANSATSAPGSAGMGNVTLVVGLVLAAAGGWFVWRGRMGVPLGKKATQHLAISETRSLGNRQYLVVATYDDKKFLLGVCPGRIEMLAPLHDAETNGERGES